MAMKLTDNEIASLMDHHRKPGLRLATASGLEGEITHSATVILALLSSAWRERRLEVLVNGCKKHPAYRAKRTPTADCEDCVRMRVARLELNDFDQ